MCHLLLLAPLLGLALFFILPWRTAALPYGVITAGSLFIYWKIMLSARRRPFIGRRAMIGQHATVTRAEANTVYVLYHDEMWRAVSREQLEAGMEVIIEDVQGLKLKVSPLPPESGGDVRRSGGVS